MLILITGAGGGIGSELALAFARHGHDLALTDINHDSLERTGARVRALGVKCFTCAADITDIKQIGKLRASVSRNAGDIDILINNAGVFVGADFIDTPLEKWRWIMDVNLWGYVYMMQAFLPRMIERGSGHIVNISSGAGIMGMPSMSAYCASKFAVAGMTEALYNEMRDKGVKVSLVCPTFTDTPILTGSPAIGYDERYGGFMRGISMSPEKAAARIVRGVLKGGFLIFTSLIGKIGYYSKKFSLRLFLASQRITYRKLQGYRIKNQ